MVKQPSKGFFKKDVLRNLAKFTRKHLRQNLLVFSCQFCGICKNTFCTELMILIIAVSIVGKGVLANETVNYDTQVKAYVFEPEV